MHYTGMAAATVHGVSDAGARMPRIGARRVSESLAALRRRRDLPHPVPRDARLLPRSAAGPAGAAGQRGALPCGRAGRARRPLDQRCRGPDGGRAARLERRITGQTRAQYEGFGWADAVHPDDVKSSVETWNAHRRRPANLRSRASGPIARRGVAALRDPCGPGPRPTRRHPRVGRGPYRHHRAARGRSGAEGIERGDPALRLHRQPRPARAAGQHHGLHQRAGRRARSRSARRTGRPPGCCAASTRNSRRRSASSRRPSTKMEALIAAILKLSREGRRQLHAGAPRHGGRAPGRCRRAPAPGRSRRCPRDHPGDSAGASSPTASRSSRSSATCWTTR